MSLKRHQVKAVENMSQKIQQLESICSDVAEYVRKRRQTREGYGWWPDWAQKLEDAGFNAGAQPKRQEQNYDF